MDGFGAAGRGSEHCPVGGEFSSMDVPRTGCTRQREKLSVRPME